MEGPCSAPGQLQAVLDDLVQAEDQHTDLVLVSEDGGTRRVHRAGVWKWNIHHTLLSDGEAVPKSGSCGQDWRGGHGRHPPLRLQHRHQVGVSAIHACRLAFTIPSPEAW